MTKPNYVYVASSWRNIMQVGVCAALRSAGIDHYDFKNPPEGTKPVCHHCGEPIIYHPLDIVGWRHDSPFVDDSHHRPAPKKGSDWEEGFRSDFDAMQRADTFVLVLPCGKSAHLEFGWAVGAGKRTAILLEDPVEPELMYRMVDYMAPSLFDLLGWLGVEGAML